MDLTTAIWKDMPSMPPVPPVHPTTAKDPPAHIPDHAPFLRQWSGLAVACEHCHSFDVYKRHSNLGDRVVAWACHACGRRFKVPRGIGDYSVAVSR